MRNHGDKLTKKDIFSLVALHGLISKYGYGTAGRGIIGLTKDAAAYSRHLTEELSPDEQAELQQKPEWEEKHTKIMELLTKHHRRT